MSDTVGFPNIQVAGWEYFQTSEEVARGETTENFIMYCLRVIWEFITCVMCFSGCPEMWHKKQVVHKVVETFRCKDQRYATVENVNKILANIQAPMVAAGKNVHPRLTTPYNTLSCTRRVVNWGTEITDYQIETDRETIMDVEGEATTSVTSDLDLWHPGGSSDRHTMDIQMREGARFVLSRDYLPKDMLPKAIQMFQVRSIFRWLGIKGDDTLLWRLLDELMTNDKTYAEMTSERCVVEQLIDNIRIPSIDGYWTVELSRGPNRTATITTPVGPIHPNAEKPLTNWLTRLAKDLPCKAEPFVNTATGRMGYTIAS